MKCELVFGVKPALRRMLLQRKAVITKHQYALHPHHAPRRMLTHPDSDQSGMELAGRRSIRQHSVHHSFVLGAPALCAPPQDLHAASCVPALRGTFPQCRHNCPPCSAAGATARNGIPNAGCTGRRVQPFVTKRGKLGAARVYNTTGRTRHRMQREDSSGDVSTGHGEPLAVLGPANVSDAVKAAAVRAVQLHRCHHLLFWRRFPHLQSLPAVTRFRDLLLRVSDQVPSSKRHQQSLPTGPHVCADWTG